MSFTQGSDLPKSGRNQSSKRHRTLGSLGSSETPDLDSRPKSRPIPVTHKTTLEIPKEEKVLNSEGIVFQPQALSQTLDLDSFAIAEDREASEMHPNKQTSTFERLPVSIEDNIEDHLVNETRQRKENSAHKKKNNRVNQFKAKNMADEEIIEFLHVVCDENLHLNLNIKPTDFNSTQGLDSFLDAIVFVTTQPDITKKRYSDIFENLHLATGTRTNFVIEILKYLIKQISKEQMLIDAVDFFKSAMITLKRVKAENEERKKEISKLQREREEFLIQSFDLKMKLKETSGGLLKLRQNLYENEQKLDSQTKQLEKKVAETKSLEYRLKHLETQNQRMSEQATEMSNRLSASKLQRSEKGEDFQKIELIRTQTQDAQNLHLSLEESSLKKVFSQLPKQNDAIAISNRMMSLAEEDIQHLAKSIESLSNKQSHEQEELKVTAVNDISVVKANFSKVQERFNQVSIENKQLLDEKNCLVAKLISRERLVSHLEEKVTQIMVEKEDTVVRLKSEIVLLQNKLEEQEESLKKRLVAMKARVEKEITSQMEDTIKGLNSKIDSLSLQQSDSKNRIERLQSDYKELQSEFTRYREDKQDNDNKRAKYTQEVEEKLQNLSQNHIGTKKKDNELIEHLEGQLSSKQKENQILFLRLKYLRQNVEQLYRQKLFLVETLQKSKLELNTEMTRLSEGMLLQNSGKSYLISVEKAVRQSQKMADLGESALQNISQIVAFSKVEKIYSLVFQAELPSTSPDAPKKRPQIVDINVSNLDSEKCNIVNELEKSEHTVERVQEMLDSLKTKLDLPPNFKPKQIPEVKGNQTREQTLVSTKTRPKVAKNEEYYLEHCPIELCSILLKFVVEQLVFIEAVNGVEDIPHSISRLLFLANSKSDLTLERELFGSFLLDSKKILDDDISNLKDKINAHKELADLNAFEPISSRKDALPKQPTEESQDDKKKSYNVLSMNVFEKGLKRSTTTLPANTLGKAKASHIDFTLKNEISLKEIELQEYKEHSKQMQKGLAAKIVKLEESIDFMTEKFEERALQTEAAFRSESKKQAIAVQQRETGLQEKFQALSERNVQLEAQVFFLENQRRVDDNRERNEDDVKSSAAPSIQSKEEQQAVPENNKTFEKDYVEEYETQLKAQISHLEGKLVSFQQNIKQFIKIRESLGTIISLTFETAETNACMLTDSLVLYYLSKALNLPKEKLRILGSENFVSLNGSEANELDPILAAKKVLSKPIEPIKMTTVIVEISLDFKKVEILLKKVAKEIKDGSSILYDLQPSYLSLNLGMSGLGTRNKLKDFTLIKKQGCSISGQDFVVSLLRCEKNCFVFMVLLLDLVSNEEYALELSEPDVFILTEGNQGLLEDAEPQALTEIIIENLTIVIRDGGKQLTCEHKVFFLSLWQDVFSTQNATSLKQNLALENNKLFNFDNKQESLAKVEKPKTLFNQTTFRDEQILRNTDKKPLENGLKNQLQKQMSCQTSFKQSVLFDSFETLFSGLEKVSHAVSMNVLVQESTKQKALMLDFEDTNSSKTVKFCLFTQDEPSINATLSRDQSSSELKENTEAPDNMPKDHYLVHTECLFLQKDHMILISVEKVQDEGLLIKMHDLLYLTSEEFYLVRKSNGHFTRLNANLGEALEFKEDFRNLVVDLTFKASVNDFQKPTQEVFSSHLNQMQNTLAQEGKNPQAAVNEMLSYPSKKRRGNVQKIQSLVMDAKMQVVSDAEQKLEALHEWKGLQERGILLYRAALKIRCSLKVGFETEDFEGQSQTQDALVTLYLKNDDVIFGVYLFKHTASVKLQISSSVEAVQLFGQDPLEMTFGERVNVLHSMLEKLFVTQEGDQVHIHVDNDSAPISEVLATEAAQQELLAEKQVSKKFKFSAEAYEEKAREIQIEREGYLDSGRAELFESDVLFEDQNFDVQIYAILRKSSRNKKVVSKRIITVGKSQVQIEQQKISNFIEESTDFDCFYIETVNAETEDLIYTLLDKRKLSLLLAKDVTIQWHSVIQNWRTELVQYFFRNLQIRSNQIHIQNMLDTSALLMLHCKSVSGGKFVHRQNNPIVTSFENCSQYLTKHLVFNQEADFAEFSYDVKLFQIKTKSKFQRDSGDKKVENIASNSLLDGIGCETVAYHLEIFNILEPDIIYKFRIPNASQNVTVPVIFYGDIMNLVEHPLKQERTTFQSDKISVVTGAVPSEKNKSVLHESIDPAYNSTFSKLVTQYIDNKLLLTIQWSKFPNKMAINILEPFSRLMWETTYEPDQDFGKPSSFSLLDTGSMEQFLTVVYDAFQPSQLMKLPESQQIVQNVVWDSLDDQMFQTLVTEKPISDDYCITIRKHKGKMNVLIFNPKLQLQEYFESLRSPRSEITTPKESVKQKVPEPIKTLVFKKEDFVQGHQLLLNNIENAQCIVEVLQLQQPNCEIPLSLCLVCKSDQKRFQVQIINLHTLKPIFHFKLLDSSHKSRLNIMVSKQNAERLCEVRPHLLTVLTHLTSQHIADQALNNYQLQKEHAEPIESSGISTFDEPNTKRLMLQCTAHAQTYNSRMRAGEKIELTLHRKVFFDEIFDKLIIAEAKITYTLSQSLPKNSWLLPQEIAQVTLVITEPESETKTFQQINLLESFSDLQKVNRRDVYQLKKMAMNILEDRAVVQRTEATLTKSIEPFLLDFDAASSPVKQQQTQFQYSLNILTERTVQVVQKEIKAAKGELLISNSGSKSPGVVREESSLSESVSLLESLLSKGKEASV